MVLKVTVRALGSGAEARGGRGNHGGPSISTETPPGEEGD